MDCTSYSEMHTDIQSGVWKDSWGLVWQSFSLYPHFSPGPAAAERNMVRPGCASRDVCPAWPAPSWQQGCPGDSTRCLSPVLISGLERGERRLSPDLKALPDSYVALILWEGSWFPGGGEGGTPNKEPSVSLSGKSLTPLLAFVLPHLTVGMAKRCWSDQA